MSDFFKNGTSWRQVGLYFLTASILYLLLKHVGFYQICDQLSKANPIYIFYAFLVSLLSVMLAAYKLKMFLRVVGCELDITRSVKITLGAYPINLIIPSKGGDFIKSWSLRDIVPFSQGAGVVILERLIDLALLCLMSFVGSFWIEQKNLTILSFSFLAIGLATMLALKIISRVNSENWSLRCLKEVGYAATCLFNNRKYFELIAMMSCIIWLGSTFQVYLLYLAVGREVPFIFCVAVVPVVIFIGLIPVTVTGMGTRDVAIVYLFSTFASASTSLSVGLLFSLLRYWILGLIGLPFVKHLKGDGRTVSVEV